MCSGSFKMHLVADDRKPSSNWLNTKVLAYFTYQSTLSFCWFNSVTQSCHERSWSLFFSSHFCFCDISYILQLHMTQDDYSFLSCSVQEWGPFQKCTQKRKQAFPHAAFTCVVWLFSPWTRNFSKGLWVSLGLIQVGAICFPESIFNLRQRIYMWKSRCLPK